MTTRCKWPGNDPLYIDYHDKEWGVPLHDERALFEFLSLECQQAGLSWITVLRKRENYRRAFHDFDPATVASMTDDATWLIPGKPGARGFDAGFLQYPWSIAVRRDGNVAVLDSGNNRVQIVELP